MSRAVVVAAARPTWAAASRVAAMVRDDAARAGEIGGGAKNRTDAQPETRM